MTQDQALIDRLMQGDRAAFEAIVTEHQKAVYGYLRARLLQANDAEDLAQEVFLRFYLGRARFEGNHLIRPWLLGIARNLLKEHLRKIKRRKEVGWTRLCLELEDLVQGDQDLYEDVLVHLPGCLEGLGQSAREAIELRYNGELQLADIGQKLRRSEGAIKLLMFRARPALKYCLQNKTRGVAHE
jgi:RNA polymerase sigma-70 factor (ECF subfamily)